MTHIIIISLFVFAIHYTLQEGEIFGAAQRLKLGKMASPLRDCPVCMVPWYGSLVYWIFYHGGLGDYILTILPAMGLNAVVMSMFPDKETLQDIAQVLKNGTKGTSKKVQPPAGRKL